MKLYDLSKNHAYRPCETMIDLMVEIVAYVSFECVHVLFFNLVILVIYYFNQAIQINVLNCLKASFCEDVKVVDLLRCQVERVML